MKSKKIIIYQMIILLIICCSIFVLKSIEINHNEKLKDDNVELKNKLLILMENKLSTEWHRYDNWENKSDLNPYILCSGYDRIVASIYHEDYGDIYFIFYKVQDEYYVKDFGNQIVDWKNYC